MELDLQTCIKVSAALYTNKLYVVFLSLSKQTLAQYLHTGYGHLSLYSSIFTPISHFVTFDFCYRRYIN